MLISTKLSKGVNKIEKFDKYSDQELLEVISKKDINSNLAFSEIYNRYSKRIYAFCKHQSFDQDVAQISFQEAWLSLFNYCSDGKKIENVSAFLISVARRRIIDFIRKEKSQPQIVEFNEETIVDDPIEKNEMLESVGYFLELGLKKLNSELREAFIMRKVNHLEYEEMIKITGFTYNCLKKRVSRAEIFLKKFIKDNLDIK